MIIFIVADSLKICPNGHWPDVFVKNVYKGLDAFVHRLRKTNSYMYYYNPTTQV